MPSFNVNPIIPLKEGRKRRTFTPSSQARYGHRAVTTSKNKDKDTPIKHGYHLEDYERQCVYEHYYDSEDKPFYVGQGTLQRAFVLRGARRNSEYNNKAIDINKIRVKIVAIDVTPEEGVRLEKELYSKYGRTSNGGNLINIMPGGKGGIVAPNRLIKVNQYTLLGKYIKTFDSLADACRAVNGDSKSISKCCQNEPYKYTCKKFVWQYDTGNNREDIVSRTMKIVR